MSRYHSRYCPVHRRVPRHSVAVAPRDETGSYCSPETGPAVGHCRSSVDFVRQHWFQRQTSADRSGESALWRTRRCPPTLPGLLPPAPPTAISRDSGQSDQYPPLSRQHARRYRPFDKDCLSLQADGVSIPDRSLSSGDPVLRQRMNRNELRGTANERDPVWLRFFRFWVYSVIKQ